MSENEKGDCSVLYSFPTLFLHRHSYLCKDVSYNLPQLRRPDWYNCRFTGFLGCLQGPVDDGGCLALLRYGWRE